MLKAGFSGLYLIIKNAIFTIAFFFFFTEFKFSQSYIFMSCMYIMFAQHNCTLNCLKPLCEGYNNPEQPIKSQSTHVRVVKNLFGLIHKAVLKHTTVHMRVVYSMHPHAASPIHVNWDKVAAQWVRVSEGMQCGFRTSTHMDVKLGAEAMSMQPLHPN